VRWLFTSLTLGNKRNNNDTTIKSNIAKNNNNRPSQNGIMMEKQFDNKRQHNTFMGGEIKMKNKKGTLRSFQNVFSSFSLLNILWILFLLLLFLLLLMMLPFGYAAI
jgi:hypothetical protein